MKYLILILFSAVMLAACGENVEVTGGTTNTLSVEYSEAVVKVVNGIRYEADSIGGIITNCVTVDPSATYGPEWQPLRVQDLNRTTAYTQEELDNCL